MRFSSTVRNLAPGVALAVLLAMSPQPVFAQCSVSGPSQVCGSAELCGPAWGAEFQWTGPNGFTGSTQCVTITEPGTYQLRTFDGDNGLWFTCTHTVTPGVVVPNTITGPTSGCSGSTVNLCGPSGAFEYAWTGPNFTSTAACVDVAEAGTYQLVVRDPVSGCSSTPGQTTVAFESCGPPPSNNCPRPACFWARPCFSRHWERFATDQLEALAACADAHSVILDGPAAKDFCKTLAPREWNLRTRARRQFAAVLANVCARELNLVALRGPSVGLDGATMVSLDDYSGSVSDWLAATDAALVDLQSRPLRDASVKQAYRRIIHTGWNISHGRGMGTTCSTSGIRVVALSSQADEDYLGDESLETAMLDDPEAPISLERLGPNPLARNTVIAFTIVTAGSEDVSIGVYDIAGRMVKQLVRATLPPGRHEAQWDGRDANGLPVRNGVYFVMGRVGSHRSDTRITVLN